MIVVVLVEMVDFFTVGVEGRGFTAEVVSQLN
jgi:hypothetical protein